MYHQSQMNQDVSQDAFYAKLQFIQAKIAV